MNQRINDIFGDRYISLICGGWCSIRIPLPPLVEPSALFHLKGLRWAMFSDTLSSTILGRSRGRLVHIGPFGLLNTLWIPKSIFHVPFMMLGVRDERLISGPFSTNIRSFSIILFVYTVPGR